MSKGGKSRWVVGGIVAGILLATRLLFHTPATSGVEEDLRNAQIEVAKGRFQAAGVLAESVLAVEPQNSAALLIVGQAQRLRKQHAEAAHTLSRIPETAAEWSRAARLRAEICHFEILQLQVADELYLQLLAKFPEDLKLHESRARLLGLCGRRDAAVPHVLRLVRAGVETDLLMLIVKESGGLTDPELLTQARHAAADDPYPVLGQATQLEMEGKHQDALQMLQESDVRSDSISTVWLAAICRQLRNTNQLSLLSDVVPANWQPGSADEWMALSQLAEQQGNRTGALRCAWEAVRIKPELLEPLNRVAALLRLQGRSEEAQPFSDRVDLLNQLRELQQLVIFSGGTADYEAAYELISTFRNAGRLWEAWAWGASALAMPQADNRLQKLMTSLRQEIAGLPLKQTADYFNPALAIDLSDLAVPPVAISQSRMSAIVSQDIQFARETTRVGFEFTYFNGSDVATRRMFEFTGGGVASIDFDCDGWPDIFCTQGKRWQQPDSDHHDRLFRNIGGDRFVDSSVAAGFSLEQGFGQGAAVGDINNDGFPDLYVANTHQNTIWINNGDGTFSEQPLPEDSAAWTTSCMIADLNGDGHPDLYDVNYVSDDDVFERLCKGEHGTVMCTPYDFTAARDRIWINSADGEFADSTEEFSKQPPVGKGLGIIGFRSDEGLHIFVANDTTANLFYQSGQTPSGWPYSESGVAAGLAYSGGGKAEACMGIAFADCDLDGRPDLHVTNFLHESNTLYSSVAPSLYEDRTLSLQLHDATLPVLGFGTQFLDANLDGQQELFVTNGYTEDLTADGTPYQMLPYLFEWTGEGFGLHEPGHAGPWSAEEMVGRAVARMDWNRDGKPDLAVGLLDAPTFLLTNQSEADQRNWVSVSVSGRGGDRDAIGATIRISGKGPAGPWSQVFQITAGDGYQCSNQRVIHAGSKSEIQQIEVSWPSGDRMEITEPPQNSRIHVVEGGKAFRVPR